MSKADTDAQLKEQAIASAEIVYHYKLIAQSIGRSHDTLLNWRKEDEDFAYRLSQGRVRFIEKHMKTAKPEFLLERLEPELFMQRSATDHTTKGESLNDVRQLTDEELEQKIEQYISSRKAK